MRLVCCSRLRRSFSSSFKQRVPQSPSHPCARNKSGLRRVDARVARAEQTRFFDGQISAPFVRIEALAGDSVRGRAREVEQGRDDDIGIEQEFARGLGIGIRDHARQGRAARQDRVHGHARAGELLRPDLRFGFERGLRRPMTLEVLEVDTRSGDRSDKRMDKTRRHPPIDLSLVPVMEQIGF